MAVIGHVSAVRIQRRLNELPEKHTKLAASPPRAIEIGVVDEIVDDTNLDRSALARALAEALRYPERHKNIPL